VTASQSNTFPRKRLNYNNEGRCFLCGPCREVITRTVSWESTGNPCGGGIEYLHRDPATRKRRRNGKSQIWDSKIRSASIKGLGPEKDCVGKIQQHIQKTDPSSRQRGRPRKQDRNCQIVIAKYLVMSPRWSSTPRLTDWLTVSRNVTLTLTWESTDGAMIQLWDIRQPIRMSAGDTVKIRYQEKTIKDRRL
jgi:hypothetical protein